MSEPRMDTAHKAAHELEAMNNELATFGHKWSEAAGNLKRELARQEKALAVALIALRDSDLTIPERAARARIAIDEAEATKGITEGVTELEALCEEFKTRFRVCDRRSSNAQSILSLHREEDRIGRIAG